MSPISLITTLLGCIVFSSCIYPTFQDTSRILNIPQNFSYDKIDEYLAPFRNTSGNPHKFTTDCKRTCTANERRICYFNFYLENYAAMGPACNNCANGVVDDCFNDQCVMGDGVERGILSVNRMIPGPHIEVCKNDLIVVDVTNAMSGSASTIHWHGILQAGTQYMDGVPYVTQCPIYFNNQFRYGYWAVEVGTHFWHSHTGHHKSDGHYGALTIRGPASDDPNSHLYDVDNNVVVISDWQHDTSSMFDPGLPTRKPGVLPENILVNGKGKFTFTGSGVTTATPYELFHFVTGKRYRFRFINSSGHVCPIQIQIQGHNMTVIGTDAYSTEPRTVDSIVTYAGERYDVVINADKPGGIYHMIFKGLGLCKPLQIYQIAMIAYNEDPSIKWMAPVIPKPAYDDLNEGIILNHPNITNNASNVVKITDLVAQDIDQSILSGRPDVRLIMSFTNKVSDYNTLFYGPEWPHFLNNGNQVMMVGTMDGITTTFPPSPYLSQPNEIDEASLCNEKTLPDKCTNESICTCNHLLRIPLNAVVELILLDESTAANNVNHPIHLHGHSFYVTQMGQGIDGMRLTKKKVSQMERNGTRITGTAFSSPLKDTVSVPSFGYIALRFRANNPGFWIMHCHFDPHMLVGMLMTFQVGETSDYPPPPSNFPQCGNFK